ncbi:MAG TPA: YdeI/OmpD-associated family protein [Actinomycetota bacterium]
MAQKEHSQEGSPDRIDFEAPIEAGPGGGAFVRLPAAAAEIFGTRARFPVQASFNGVAYRGSTMPLGDGTFCVGVTKAVQVQAGASVGDTVAVAVERDAGERTVDVPPDLAAALASHPEAAARFEAMGYTQRKEYAAWVASAKKPETRQRRLDQAIGKIAAGTPLS